ncbi:hypothetical protein ACS0TY_005955 [Phlomoides rotata]
MASHHHCHHPAAAAPNPTSCHCHCCYTPCHNPYPLPPPPDSHPHHPPHQPLVYSPLSHLPNLPQYTDPFQEHYLRERRQPHPTVSSLLRRIATLESALSRRASHPPPSRSLRDAAARTIQSHFRAFLLHRSITLRQLKDLASIKSTLGVLKSSVSVRTRIDHEAIYHKATNLLLKLDAIQGGDPMIRNGKTSLSRELNRFLDFLEGDFVQRRALSSVVKVRQSSNSVKSRVSNSDKETGNVESGCLKRANAEKLRVLAERIDRLAEELDEEEGEVIKTSNNEFMIRNLDVSPNRTRGLLKHHGGPKVKKNVSFVENGKVYRVLRRRSDPYLEECSNDSIDRDDLVNCDENDLEDDLCREIGEIGASSKEDIEEAEEGSLLSSDGEKDSRHYSTSEGNFKSTMQDQDDNDDFIFSAPLPVKMETRGNLIDKRKKLNNI